MADVLAKKIMAPSGRWAIMVRPNGDSSWVQVESVLGDENADELVNNFQNDDEKRAEYLEDHEGNSDWEDDAAPEDQI